MEKEEVRVVIVVDDDDIRELLTTLIELDGYLVRSVPDGEAALALVSEFRPACVLVDLTLPGIDGAEVPAGDVAIGVEHEDGVVANGLHQAAESLLVPAGREGDVTCIGSVEGHGAGRRDGAGGWATLIPSARDPPRG